MQTCVPRWCIEYCRIEATEIRKEEHADNVETLANDSAAQQLLDIAKNRLAKFYTPKLYKEVLFCISDFLRTLRDDQYLSILVDRL